MLLLIRLFPSSWLKLSSSKSLRFLYAISLGWDLKKVVLNTDKTNLWKSDNPVKNVFVLKESSAQVH